jgi:hypothetical protein
MFMCSTLNIESGSFSKTAKPVYQITRWRILKDSIILTEILVPQCCVSCVIMPRYLETKVTLFADTPPTLRHRLSCFTYNETNRYPHESNTVVQRIQMVFYEMELLDQQGAGLAVLRYGSTASRMTDRFQIWMLHYMRKWLVTSKSGDKNFSKDVKSCVTMLVNIIETAYTNVEPLSLYLLQACVLWTLMLILILYLCPCIVPYKEPRNWVLKAKLYTCMNRFHFLKA